HCYVLQILDLLGAVKYLHNHNPPLAHGDIRAVSTRSSRFKANILMNGEIPLLGDLGLARRHYNIEVTLSSCLDIANRWRAPEHLIPDRMSRLNGEQADIKPTLQSDIWAFGMTIFEILSDMVPYDDVSDTMFILKLDKGELPSRPGPEITERGLSDELWSILTEGCWNFESTARPTAAKLEKKMRKLKDETQITAWNVRTVSRLFIKTVRFADRVLKYRLISHWGTFRRPSVMKLLSSLALGK
ncbi:hypothetical protein M422DRAFT_182013, partial [Sphaerobolus stellatus SS14]